MKKNIVHNTVICLVGISCAGKTTWAKELQKREPGKWKRVNRDDLRLMLDNYQLNDKNENLITEIEEDLIRKLLAKHFSIIIDATHLRESYVNDIREIVEEHNRNYNDYVEVVLKYFPVTLKDALNRNDRRAEQTKVPVHIIEEMFDKYNKNTPFKLKPLKNKIAVQNEHFQKAIICDLDGTLAHNVSRNIYDYEKVDEDEIDKTLLNLLILYSKNQYQLIFLSGREDFCYKKTEKWLRDFFPYQNFELFMRKTGDYRKDSIIKEELFKENILPYYFVSFVLDDRSQVVQMWRNLGLKTFQVAPGDF